MPTNFQYGGQAVIEGVLMRGARDLAIAVRRPDETVIVERHQVNPLGDRLFLLRWPLIRGSVVLLDSLLWGIRALTFSANLAAEAEDEQIKGSEMAAALLIALVVTILMFVVIPTGAVHFLHSHIESVFCQNLVEGIIRIAIFLGYVVAISRINDIARVFQYHGAEHKVIHTYEANEPLTVANARKYSILHPRCGTSFLLIVMVVSILVFSLLGDYNLFWRITSRILLLPVVAGLGYELIKFSGRHKEARWLRVLILPGLWLQKLTTREPDDQQIAVAIRALEAVLEAESSRKK